VLNIESTENAIRMSLNLSNDTQENYRWAFCEHSEINEYSTRKKKYF